MLNTRSHSIIRWLFYAFSSKNIQFRAVCAQKKMDKCDFDFYLTQQGDLMVSVTDFSCRCRDTSSTATTATTCLSCLPKHVWINKESKHSCAYTNQRFFIRLLHIIGMIICHFVYFYMQLQYLLHDHPQISILLCLSGTFMSHRINFSTMFSKHTHAQLNVSVFPHHSYSKNCSLLSAATVVDFSKMCFFNCAEAKCILQFVAKGVEKQGSRYGKTMSKCYTSG